MYKITDLDLQEGIPVSKIFQLKWKSPLYKEAKSRVAKLHLQYLDGIHTSEEVKLLIYVEVEKLKIAYPNEFPIPGWWDKHSANKLVAEYTTPKTLKVVQVDVCYICRVRLDSGETAKCIDGVWWKIHGRCARQPVNSLKQNSKSVSKWTYREVIGVGNV